MAGALIRAACLELVLLLVGLWENRRATTKHRGLECLQKEHGCSLWALFEDTSFCMVSREAKIT